MAYCGDKVVDILLERGDSVRETKVKGSSHVLNVVRCVQFLRQLQ